MAEKEFKTLLSIPRLPSVYTEVEYVECVKGNWIDTGYKPVNTDRIETGMFFTQSNPTNAIFGTSYDASYNDVVLWSAGNCRWGGNKVFAVSDRGTNTFGYSVISFDTNSLIINGTTITGSGTPRTFGTSRNLCIFHMNDNSYFADCGGRLYYFKITNGSTLKVNLVPCIRNSDNVAGVYDTVRSMFITSASSVPLTTGKRRTFQTLTVNGTEASLVKDSDGCLLFTKYFIPFGYIENTEKEQYIDTGVSGTRNTTILVRYNPGDTIGLRLVIGRDISGTRVTTLWAGTSSASLHLANYYHFQSLTLAQGDKWVIDKMNKTAYYRNEAPSLFQDATTNLKNASSSGSPVENVNMRIFSGSEATGGWTAGTKVSHVKLYDGSTVVREFVPCMLRMDIPANKCADSSLPHTIRTIGMWDLIQDKFYTNAEGNPFVLGD